MRHSIAKLITWVSLSPVALAQELPENYTPTRPMGMGGAFTAVADDQNSLWTNPGGIGRIRKAYSRKNLHLLAFPNIIAGWNKDGLTFYNTIKATNSSEGTTSNVQNAIESTEGVQDKPLWARASVAPVAFFEPSKGAPMAFGLVSNTRMQLQVNSNEPTAAQIQTVSDFAAVMGFGFQDRSNRLNMGVSFRPTTRYAFDDKLPVELLTNKGELQKKIRTGSNIVNGLGVDIGALWTLADFWFPTIGFSVLNLPTGCRTEYLNPYAEVRQTVCGTAYSGKINNPEAESLLDPMDTRFGVAITPRLTNKLALRVAADVHHMYFNSGTNYYGLSGVAPLKQIHAGMELFVGNPLQLSPLSARVGFNQGFFTVGGTIRIGVLLLEVASFGQDISASTTPREDRRTLVSLSLEF